MKDLDKDFKEFIVSLNENDVEYLLIGGYAVAYHGYPRFTQDLDIWVNPSYKNADKILNALRDFGFPTEKLSPEDFMNPEIIFQMGNPPFRIDILSSIPGVKFENCFKRRNKAKIDGITISVISRNDLKKNKKATGRKKDLLDFEYLGKKRR